MKKTRSLWAAGIAAVCLLGASMTGVAAAADTKADEDEVTTKEAEQLRKQAAEKGAERGRPKESWIDPEPTRAQPESDGPVRGEAAERLREQAAEKGAERGRPKEAWTAPAPGHEPGVPPRAREEKAVKDKEIEQLREQAAEKGAERGRPKESWIDTEPDRQPAEEEAGEKKNGNGKKNGGGKSPKE